MRGAVVGRRESYLPAPDSDRVDVIIENADKNNYSLKRVAKSRSYLLRHDDT